VHFQNLGLRRSLWTMVSVATLVRTAQRAAKVPDFFPVLLSALPEATTWLRSGFLTPSAVAAARAGSIMTVKRSPDPLFMYTEVGVPDRLPDSATGVGARTEFVDMDPIEFVQACELQDGTTPPFHYYTCGVKQHAPDFEKVGVAPARSWDGLVMLSTSFEGRWCAGAIDDEQACPGWERLVVDENAAAQWHATPAHSSLWVGGNGSTTQAHYDVLHNVFVQVLNAC